jgi:hypothetical protein
MIQIGALVRLKSSISFEDLWSSDYRYTGSFLGLQPLDMFLIALVCVHKFFTAKVFHGLKHLQLRVFSDLYTYIRGQRLKTKMEES